MHQTETEIRLVTELVEIDPHQASPSQHQHRGRKRRISEQRERQPCTDAPENQDIEGEGEQGIKDPQGEAEALSRERTRVVRDALIGIINIRRLFVVGVEDVIRTVAHVVADQTS